jgi:hypothetical protein
MDGAADQIR